MKPVSLGPFAGINNRLPDSQLSVTGTGGRKVGDFLRDAINVDITNSGTLQRRAGTVLTLPGTDVHSLWGEGDKAFYVDGADLCAPAAGMTKHIVRSGLTPKQPASFASMGDAVYWSNNAVLERITNGVSSDIGVPVPNPAPSAVALAGGSLPAGLYQLAITAMSDSGEESGATWPIQVTVPADGVITISDLAAGAHRINVYITALNGDVLFLAETLAAGTTSCTITVMPALGRQIPTLGLRAMPPGHIVRQFSGRLLVAASNILFISEPYAPGLHNPLHGYIPLPARITIVEPCEKGVYIVADQTYWLAGPNPVAADLLAVLPYGAVEGTGGKSETGNEAWWFSERGLVVGDQSGQVKNVQEDDIVVEQAVMGAAFYREQDGLRQIVSSLFGTEQSAGAATSFMSAEVI